jgi:hypothetical protein
MTFEKLSHLFRRAEQMLPANDNSVAAFASAAVAADVLRLQAASRVVARRARWSSVAFNEKVPS